MFVRFTMLRRWLPVVVLTTCTGCNSWLLDDTPARDDSFRDAAGFDRAPPENSNSSPWGLSSRSRDIERDLGVK